MSTTTFFAAGTRRDPHWNLALEETLCRRAAASGRPGLFLWQNDPCCVVGLNQNPWLECDLAAMRADGVLLARRRTGGGAVYHDGGNLNFSFCFPAGLSSNAARTDAVLAALASLGVPAETSGRNDLVCGGRKFSGCAFRTADGFTLHHGTLLIRSDLSRLDRYLTPDADKLRAKGVRSVRARVVNLSELSPAVTAGALARALRAAFEERFGCAEEFSAPAPDADLAAEYASPAFLYGRTPRFSDTVSLRFPSCGVTVGLTVEDGAVADCRVWTDSLDGDLSAALARRLTGAPYREELVASAAAALLGEDPL